MSLKLTVDGRRWLLHGVPQRGNAVNVPCSVKDIYKRKYDLNRVAGMCMLTGI